MHIHVYKITALTNLHVGSGDTSYGAVDKMIQLDPATQFPTIFGQSLKGALREYFQDQGAEKEEEIFGSPVKPEANEDPAAGNVAFLSADLMAIPVPDTDLNSASAYFLTGSNQQAEAFVNKANAFSKNGTLLDTKPFKSNFDCQEWDDKAFKAAATQIPVLARNYLENGMSRNLWYEQYLPHQSIFATVLFSPKEDLMDALMEQLHGKVLQIGANASVGYGYCLFEKIN